MNPFFAHPIFKPANLSDFHAAARTTSKNSVQKALTTRLASCFRTAVR